MYEIDPVVLSYLARKRGKTPEQYLDWREEAERQLTEQAGRLEERRQKHNTSPLVEAHQPTEALCDARCREAEQAAWIQLPVVAASRTTSAPTWAIPTRDELISHMESFGVEDVEACAAHYGLSLEMSPLAEYRKERAATEKRYSKSPLLQSKLIRLAKSSLPKLRSELVSELQSGTLTVPEIAAEFGVQERTVRGWRS